MQRADTIFNCLLQMEAQQTGAKGEPKDVTLSQLLSTWPADPRKYLDTDSLELFRLQE